MARRFSVILIFGEYPTHTQHRNSALACISVLLLSWEFNVPFSFVVFSVSNMSSEKLMSLQKGPVR